MEIIPILSTIILVATIATFILAIAAYVLYKVRERRARSGGVRTDVVMDQTYVAPQPALAGQPYAPNALPPMQPVGPALALPSPQMGYGNQGWQQGYGQPGPLAVDTNADGRYDTVYEARPTYQNPVTGAPAAYQPAPDTQPRAMLSAPGMPGMPGVQGLPGMSAAPMPMAAPVPAPVPVAAPAPGQGRNSMFFEVTNQGLVPTPGAVAAAEQQERARLGAIHREQDRLDVAEDTAKERLDTLRRQQDAPAWL